MVELLVMICGLLVAGFFLEKRIAKIEKLLRGKIILTDISNITQEDKIIISNYVK